MSGFKKRIDLGFTVIDIKWVSAAEMRIEADMAEDETSDAPLGMWVAEDKTIYLQKNLGTKMAKQILLHEAAHAMLDLYHEVS